VPSASRTARSMAAFAEFLRMVAVDIGSAS
jgi:hypothetical protein